MGFIFFILFFSFLGTDTLIRDSKDSKIKTLWVRIFKKRLFDVFNEKMSLLSKKLNSKIPKNEKGLPDINSLVKTLSEKYAYKVFVVFILSLLLSITYLIFSII